MPFSSLLSCARAQTVSSYADDLAGNLTAFAANQLRITNKGLLVEAAATNLQINSGDLTLWGTVAITPASSAVLGPDGAGTLQLLTATGSDARVRSSPSVTVLNATAYSISAWFKSSGNVLYGNLDITGGANAGAQITLATGAVHATAGTTYVGSSANSALGGLARGTLTFTTTTTSIILNLCPSEGGGWGGLGVIGPNGVPGGVPDTVYAGFAQLELGGPTSYIPTGATAVTRNADAVTLLKTGVGRVQFTFDDYSTQTVSGIDPTTQYAIPTNLNRPTIARITGYAV